MGLTGVSAMELAYITGLLRYSKHCLLYSDLGVQNPEADDAILKDFESCSTYLGSLRITS